jgi:hypothetical protein
MAKLESRTCRVFGSEIATKELALDYRVCG